MLLDYARASALDLEARRLTLETVTPAAREGVGLLRPRFFDGFLTRPETAASGLLQVAKVADAAYVDRERVVSGGADPLVTSDGSRLRFEAFSRCGGVLARLDVLPAGLDGSFISRGTTNIDVNEPLRRLLTRVVGGNFLHLEVGSDGLIATAANDRAAERKVTLSDRWLRGLAEAQASAAGFEPRAELSGVELLRFVQGLRAKAQGWVLPSGPSLRLTSRARPGAVWLARSDRLETVLPLLASATRVRVYGPTVSSETPSAPSAWEVELPDARFVLHLSAAPTQGLAGDGSVLAALAASDAAADSEVVGARLDHQTRLDAHDLAADLRLDVERVRSALTWLAVSGRLGYDVSASAYFHRDLPYDPGMVSRLNPRLRGAEDLVTRGGVHLLDDGRADVRGSTRLHRVRTRADGAESCTCEWSTSHGVGRGPCKHILAVRLVRRGG